jgi:hypothetical protein
MLEEFEDRVPARRGHGNHVPAVAGLMRRLAGLDPALPRCRLFGMWGTSVSENPFAHYDEEEPEGERLCVGWDEVYVLERHRERLGLK